ncbi:AAA family ATPase, partial [Candidatus Bathyarchaeota archaeon]|nr:AAA family ATPase [Candidatus Bathyarchaeota archaeon]
WIMVAAIARNTAILIEEPESHQHPGGLVKSLEALLDLAKRNNVQIFATTHSLEFIKFVEKIAEERKLDMSTFFIEMDEKGRIESRTITSEDSQYLTKMGLDIRFLDVV